jgi:hypothetical protein
MSGDDLDANCPQHDPLRGGGGASRATSGAEVLEGEQFDEVTRVQVKELRRAVPGVVGVVKAGGSPCQDLSSLNVDGTGILGFRSILGILGVVLFMSAAYDRHPFKICSSSPQVFRPQIGQTPAGFPAADPRRVVQPPVAPRGTVGEQILAERERQREGAR